TRRGSNVSCGATSSIGTMRSPSSCAFNHCLLWLNTGLARPSRGDLLPVQRKAILNAVRERPPRRLDDVGRSADRAPALVRVLRVDQHAGRGGGAVLPVQNTDLVV